MNMTHIAGVEVYRSLIDKHLDSLKGDQARAFGLMWQEKTGEYAFRRNLMQQFDDYGVCALRALRDCMKVYHVELSVLHQQLLMEDLGKQTRV